MKTGAFCESVGTVYNLLWMSFEVRVFLGKPRSQTMVFLDAEDFHSNISNATGMD